MCPVPAGRAEGISPVIYRWGRRWTRERVPGGTEERFFRPLTGLGRLGRFPSDETVGYFRVSLTGQGRGYEDTNFTDGHGWGTDA